MIRRISAAASVMAALLASEAAEARTLLPHRAVYQLELDYTTPDSAIANAVGDLVFQIDDNCDAWSTITQMRFAVRYDSGEESRFGTSLSAWEKKDGTAYHFQVKRRSTVPRDEVIDGEAVVPPEGEAIATFLSPSERTMVLPKDTLFPTLHSLAVLDAAEAGELSIYRTVFDGTEEESLYEVNSVIIAPVAPAEAATLDSPLLKDVASWRVALAYFEAVDDSGQPSHEAILRLYDNGVIDEQTFDLMKHRVMRGIGIIGPIDAA